MPKNTALDKEKGPDFSSPISCNSFAWMPCLEVLYVGLLGANRLGRNL